MAKDILGVYRSKDAGHTRGRTAAIAHTPDATKYHDASAERLEGESAAGATMLNKLPGNHGFSGMRGVIIPRATMLGGSRGHDHHKAPIIHIDPGPFGEGGIKVDLSQVDPAQMAAAVEESSRTANDLEEAALNAFAAVAGHSPSVQSREQPRYAVDEERRAPIQMPGVYVVPKASPGGGQQVKRAAFTDRQLRERDEQVRQQTTLPRTMPKPVQGSLHSAFDSPPATQTYAPPAPEPQAASVHATFEIPGGHQFRVLYHDVVRQGMTLVLIYDHSRPSQLVYFPPPMAEEPTDATALALLVHAREGTSEKNILYRVHSPGIQFRHGNYEYCILLIEKEKEIKDE